MSAIVHTAATLECAADSVDGSVVVAVARPSSISGGRCRLRLDGDRSVDVAIVGAGYTGLWTAYSLLRADPSLRVLVVERETVGFGASGRNGGWCVGELAGGLAGAIATYGRGAGDPADPGHHRHRRRDRPGRRRRSGSTAGSRRRRDPPRSIRPAVEAATTTRSSCSSRAASVTYVDVARCVGGDDRLAATGVLGGLALPTWRAGPAGAVS